MWVQKHQGSRRTQYIPVVALEVHFNCDSRASWQGHGVEQTEEAQAQCPLALRRPPLT